MAESWVPNPDPTALTTEALNVAIAHVCTLYDLRFEQLDLRLEQRFQAQQKAIDAALVASDLKSTALADKIEQNVLQLAQMVTREQHSAVTQAFTTRLEAIALEIKGLITRPEYNVQHKSLEDKLDDLKDRANIQQGRGIGANALWVYLVAAITIAGVLYAIFRR